MHLCVLASLLALVGFAAGAPTPIQEKDRRIGALSRSDRDRIDRQDQDGPYTVKPYQFGFELEDGFGMSQYRSESSDGSGAVKGSYGYMDPFGVYRKVEYTADDNGYRAVIRSNEPGTANQNVADALFIVEPPPEGVVNQDLQDDINPRNAKA
ncbi:cuticle protein 10.9-like [Parasteatoda tepidariorum]|uniref:cuticle protein 10.9-like n=1 Tax=Parasteatoda tepidariorum TaxID=114398 RepID=UPI00077FE2FF|nr:cuticle protein 10.9-like [Parasteatoda tepidariorum]